MDALVRWTYGQGPRELDCALAQLAGEAENEADLARRFDLLQRLTPPGVLDGVGFDAWRTGRLVGTVEQVREQLEQWQELGVAHVIAGLGAVPFAVTTLDDLDMVASAAV